MPRPQPTTAEATVDAPASVRIGDATTLKGEFPDAGNAEVAILNRSAGENGYKRVGTARTGAGGRWSARVKPRHTGDWRARLVAPPTGDALADAPAPDSESDTELIRVRSVTKVAPSKRDVVAGDERRDPRPGCPGWPARRRRPGRRADQARPCRQERPLQGRLEGARHRQLQRPRDGEAEQARERLEGLGRPRHRVSLRAGVLVRPGSLREPHGVRPDAHVRRREGLRTSRFPAGPSSRSATGRTRSTSRSSTAALTSVTASST